MAGTIFKRGVKAPIPPGGIVSSPLGDTILTGFVQNDVGKAIKLQNGTGAVAGTYEAVLCASGDPIEGFITSVEPNTVNSGFSFGGFQTKGQFEVLVGTTAVALGDFIQFESQAALATAGVPSVVAKADFTIRTDTLANQGADTIAALNLLRSEANWKCTQILTGTGATAGDKILIERVG